MTTAAVSEVLGGKENLGARARLSGKRRGGCSASTRGAALAYQTNHSKNTNRLRRESPAGNSDTSNTNSLTGRSAAADDYTAASRRAGSSAADNTVSRSAPRQDARRCARGTATPISPDATPTVVPSHHTTPSPLTLRQLHHHSLLPDHCENGADAVAVDDTTSAVPPLPLASPAAATAAAVAVPPSSPFSCMYSDERAAALPAAVAATTPPRRVRQHALTLSSPRETAFPQSPRHRSIVMIKRQCGAENVPTSPAGVLATQISSSPAATSGEGTPYSGTARRVAVRRRQKPPSPLSLTPSRLYDSTAASRAGVYVPPPSATAGGFGGSSPRHPCPGSARRKRAGVKCASASKVGVLEGRTTSATAWDPTPEGTRRAVTTRHGGDSGVSGGKRDVAKGAVFFPAQVEGRSCKEKLGRPTLVPGRSRSPSAVTPTGSSGRTNILLTPTNTTEHKAVPTTSAAAAARSTPAPRVCESTEKVCVGDWTPDEAVTGVVRPTSPGTLLPPPARCNDAVSRELESKARHRSSAATALQGDLRRRYRRRHLRKEAEENGETTASDSAVETSLEGDLSHCTSVMSVLSSALVSPAASGARAESDAEMCRGARVAGGCRAELDMSCSSIDTTWSIASFDEKDREPTAREGAMAFGEDPVARALFDLSDDEHCYPRMVAFDSPFNDRHEAHSNDQCNIDHQIDHPEPELRLSEPQQQQRLHLPLVADTPSTTPSSTSQQRQSPSDPATANPETCSGHAAQPRRESVDTRLHKLNDSGSTATAAVNTSTTTARAFQCLRDDDANRERWPSSSLLVRARSDPTGAEPAGIFFQASSAEAAQAGIMRACSAKALSEGCERPAVANRTRAQTIPIGIKCKGLDRSHRFRPIVFPE